MAGIEGLQQPIHESGSAKKPISRREMDHILHPHKIRDRLVLTATAGILAVTGAVALRGTTQNNTPIETDKNGYVIVPSAPPDISWINLAPAKTEIPINNVPLADITKKMGYLIIDNSGNPPDKNNPLGYTVDLFNATIGDIYIDKSTGSATLTMLLPGDTLSVNPLNIFAKNLDGSKTQSVRFNGLTVKVDIDSFTWTLIKNSALEGLEGLAPYLEIGKAIPLISIFTSDPSEITKTASKLKSLREGLPNDRTKPLVEFRSNYVTAEFP